MFPWNDQFHELFEYICVHSWYHTIIIHVPYLGEFPPTKTYMLQTLLKIQSGIPPWEVKSPNNIGFQLQAIIHQKLRCPQPFRLCFSAHADGYRDRLDPNPKTSLELRLRCSEAIRKDETPMVGTLEWELSWPWPKKVLIQPVLGAWRIQKMDAKLWMFFGWIWSNLWWIVLDSLGWKLWFDHWMVVTPMELSNLCQKMPTIWGGVIGPFSKLHIYPGFNGTKLPSKLGVSNMVSWYVM